MIDEKINSDDLIKRWKNKHEKNLSTAYQKIIESEDWDKFSNCEDGYINVAEEKKINGFIYEKILS